MFGSFGWMELLLILIIVLIIFGAGKIPQLGEGLGKAIKGFKRSVYEPDSSESPSTLEEPNQSIPNSASDHQRKQSEAMEEQVSIKNDQDSHSKPQVPQSESKK